MSYPLVIRLMIAMARLLIARGAAGTRQEGGTAPPAGTADRGTARHPRRDMRAKKHALTPGNAITKTDSNTETEHETSNTPESHKHLKSVAGPIQDHFP